MDRLELEVAKLREEYERQKRNLHADGRLVALEELLVRKISVITDEVRTLRAKTCSVVSCPNRRICE